MIHRKSRQSRLLLAGAASLCCALFTLAPAAADAAPQHPRAAKSKAKAPASVNRSGASNRKATGGANRSNANRNNTRDRNNNNNRPGRDRPDNVVAGNTVVVAPGRPSNGYYDNGRYYESRDWDDDDDDFLEFLGKTAAVTAGVSVVSAVIGSVVNDKPEGDCDEVVSNGTTYLNCNGTWYSAVTPGSSQTQYQVVAPPG